MIEPEPAVTFGAEIPVRLAPGVSVQMLDASFWVSRSKNPRHVRMTRGEIGEWNRMNESVLFPGSADFYIISDLRRADSVASCREIRSDMIRFGPHRVWYKKAGGETRALSSKDIRSFFDAMDYGRLEQFSYFAGGRAADSDDFKKDFPVRKAVCVRRSNLRLVPDDEFYTDDKDYWYDDAAQISGILMNEPVLVMWESRDAAWLYVRTSYCTGWIHAEDVAFCTDEEFSRRFDFTMKEPASFVTVTSERASLSSRYALPVDSGLDAVPELFMGTYLFTADWADGRFDNDSPGRKPYASYLVEIPYRKPDGSLGAALAAVPAGICSLGLLDFTTENVLSLAFRPLGLHYGWGGMAGSRDCSEYLKDIFRCFGFLLPRNSRAQLASGGKTLDFEGMSVASREKALASIEPGTPMGFPGHVFLYLGAADGRHFVISALGAYYFDSETGLVRDDANSVSINTLDVLRSNGKSWLEMLAQAKMLVDDGSFSKNRVTLNPKWQFAGLSRISSGEAVLHKSQARARRNITVAVNAGHGTSGGSAVMTFSHPDKSPKVTGGTNAAGAVESIAVSAGMTFKDGRREDEVNLRVARILRRLLLRNGYDVLMIRDSDDARLDNVARTVIADSCADIHISVHFDGDNEKSDKGVFFCAVPDGVKTLPNVRKHWQESERLGECLVRGLSAQGLAVFGSGRMEVDLTQTSYSTIPTAVMELGNEWTSTRTDELERRAQGLLEGIELFFDNK